ncbi:stage II sporulation protein D [Anoxybacillus voinovskiensis]|uniref:Stage II sporulation protein D n=1 Tax=Anoxybacteroides voinovskiense TaxID=230470 RepID=A0A840DTY1_9BACL|nr:SpoIID/LytB domain-containing protein [Anoxybacillus voinovskiensis]MBB4073777.1 stage II sporulation protein D [Anoxybacillus voinovskiensis]
MKHLLSLLFAGILFFALPVSPKAMEVVTYANPVNVLVYQGNSVSILINGNYQLFNKQTGAITPLSTNTTLTVQYTPTGIVVSDGTSTYTSTLGFTIQETKGVYALSLLKVNTTLYRGSADITSQTNKLQVVNILDMEDYLKGVVPNEMPSSWPKEALKAQAIAARSYAEKTKGTLTTNPNTQVYGGYSSEKATTNQAVDETKGLYVKYNGQVIQAFFHSTSGGKTANVGDVWNSNQSLFPYLSSVSDPYESSPYSNWSFTFTPTTILQSFGFTASSTVLYDVSITKKGVNGEIGAVTVMTSAGEKTISGNESTIRSLFPINDTRYYNKLLSNWFTITVNKDGGLYVQTLAGKTPLYSLSGQQVQTTAGVQAITDAGNVKVQTTDGVTTIPSTIGTVTSVIVNGKGWGHRIGMSQYGAKAFAERGWTAEQILQYYFKGAVVSK